MHAQIAQIAIIDPDNARTRRENALELLPRMNLDERLHFERAPQGEQIAQKIVAEYRGDEQKGIGPGGARLPYLPGVDDEILAQNGDFRRATRFLQVRQRTRKEILF